MSHISTQLLPQVLTSGLRASLFDFEDAAPQLQQKSGFENAWANFLTYVYSPVIGSKIVDHWSDRTESFDKVLTKHFGMPSK